LETRNKVRVRVGEHQAESALSGGDLVTTGYTVPWSWHAIHVSNETIITGVNVAITSLALIGVQTSEVFGFFLSTKYGGMTAYAIEQQ
jgi:hypothetical protein